MLKKFLLVILLIIYLLTGCNNNLEPTNIEIDDSNDEEAIENNKVNDELIVGLEKYQSIKNPLMFDSNRYANNLIFDGLISNDDKGNVIPNIAYKWEVLKDKSTYIFYLNKGIKFHDGKELTTKDVEFTYYTIIEEGNKGPLYNKVIDIEGIKVIDDYTISFKVSDINSFKIYDFNISILPKHIYEFDKIEDFEENEDLIGSGPFKLIYEDDNKIELEKFNEYYFKKSSINKIKIVNLKNNIEINELDIINLEIDNDNFDKLKDNKNYKLLANKGESFSFIGLNINSPLFYDVRVRKALLYGFDREKLVNKIYKEFEMICNYPDVFNNYDTDIEKYEYNPKKSKKLLEDAGWTDIDNDGYLENKFGQKFEFTFIAYRDSKYSKTLSDLIVKNYKDIGIKVNIQYLYFENVIKKVYDDRNYDSFAMSFELDLSQNPIPIYSLEADIYNGLNVTSYYSEESDKIFNKLKEEFDINKREELLKSWAYLANKELPLLFISYKPEIWLVNNRINGFIPKPFYDFTYQIENIDINNNN